MTTEKEPDEENSSDDDLSEDDLDAEFEKAVTPGFDAARAFATALPPNFFERFAAKNLMPPVDFSSILAPHMEGIQRLATANVTAALTPMVESIRTSMFSPEVQASMRSITEGFATQYQGLLESLHLNLKPLIDADVIEGFNRSMLPPNLRSASKQIRALEVMDFVTSEGIPLYLVPRASIGVRLLKADSAAARRQVLSDRFDALVVDCAAVIDRATDPVVADAVHFVRDGLGAIRGGHHASAQAIFTLVLDTLIMDFYPEREDRKKITNRRRDDDAVPEVIDRMALHQSYVWLPIWNAHMQFWKDRGDTVPYPYSRHASVHGASKRQYSKRNCIQVLMLVTSLIGFADQLAKQHRVEPDVA
mgnify:CR=1 FL=1